MSGGREGVEGIKLIVYMMYDGKNIGRIGSVTIV